MTIILQAIREDMGVDSKVRMIAQGPSEGRKIITLHITK